MRDGSHAQLHGTCGLGRDHLAMVVVEASNDGWSKGTGGSVEEKNEAKKNVESGSLEELRGVRVC